MLQGVGVDFIFKRAILSLIISAALLTSVACSEPDNESGNGDTGVTKPITLGENKPKPQDLLNPDGSTLKTRFDPPEGFIRTRAEQGSFSEYLRQIPLKPDGTAVKYFDGRTKYANVHAAVMDIDVGDRDLQQCADAVMRLRAEYLYKNRMYDKIHFNFTNGFNAQYSKWRSGYRISIEGNDAYWRQSAGYSEDYSTFRKYMDIVFAYAGTLSLSKEMEPIAIEDAKPGDVFIEGGSPGHAVIIVDMAVNEARGEKVFMIAQSYMPAQNIHILINDIEKSISPWYYLSFGETLKTPEWNFYTSHLMRFKD